MKKNLWRRRFAATIAGGTLAINASHVLAVDFANITATGDGTPTLSIDAGQGTVANAGLGTEGFFVEAATGEGIYPVRIGDSASDDFSSGVLLGSIRENPNRTNPLGSVYYPFSSVAADSNYGTPNGTLRLVVDSGGGGIAGGVGNANMAAAYFPFSQGWVGGTIRQNANGTPPNANSSLNGIDLVDLILGYGADGGGRNHVKIAGVDDSRRQGLLFVNHAKNEDNYAAVAPLNTGEGWMVSTHQGAHGGFETDPFAMVYIPYGTANVTMASIHGASGTSQQPTVLGKSGSDFTVVREGVGTYRLSIAGQTPTSGVLMLNSGGAMSGSATSTSDNLITYQASGNDWIIQMHDAGAAATATAPAIPATLETPNADRSQAFQFAFMPFNAPPTAPGPNIPVETFKNKVIGFNVNVIEHDGTQNESPGLSGSITSGTEGYRLEWLRQNKGDNGIAVDGAFLSNADGIMFGSVSEGYRDNTGTFGDAAYGMIAAGDGGGGWEFATHIADPGLGVASSVELNVNFSAVFIGNDTPFAKATNAAQSGGSLNVSLPGVNTLTDGVLVAQVHGNNDDYAVVAPAVDGSNWSVTTYDNNTGQSNMTVNWLYLPYTADNLVAGRVAADGVLQSSTNTAEFTLVKDPSEAGTYLLTIPGKTPADGTLLLTAEETNGVLDNVLVYEAAGSSFKIRSIDQVSYEEKSLLVLPSLEDTNFSFAFIDHDAPPTLGGGNFLEADFNQDGNVDGTDLAAWKSGFGTGTTRAEGDANGDQVVDGADFLAWQRQLGASPAAGATAAAVPEPTSLGLAAIAGLALAARRKR